LANATLTPWDFEAKSLLFAQKYAFGCAKRVTLNLNVNLANVKLPSVTHIEIDASAFTGGFFKKIVTDVLEPSNIISFSNMNVFYGAVLAIPHLALLKNIQHVKLISGDPEFISQALKQLTTLESVDLPHETSSSSVIDVLTSQKPHFLWKYLNIGLKTQEHLFTALLPTHTPHLKELELRFPSLNRALKLMNFYRTYS
jgi:hypothetical protein